MKSIHIAGCAALAWGLAEAADPRLLVFSGQPIGVYRHDGIDYGLKLMKALAPKGGFAYDTSTTPDVFTDANLAKYQAVMMNCDCRGSRMFSQPQREAFQRFIRRGGGWAGTHCAAAIDLNIDWPWYVNLVGAVHKHHTDGIQTGILKVEDRAHGSMTHFTTATWNLQKEELYFYLNSPAPSWRPNPALPKVNVLLTFQSWGNGQTKPPAGNKADSSHLGAMSWYHEFEGGRSWYTGLGHENWVYQDSLYIKHLLGGLKYVLRMDGTSFLSENALRPSSQSPRVWIGSAPGPAAMTSGYRVFDFLGARVQALPRAAVGVPHE
jgi:type 1 glutamine amidotransferase